MPKYITAILIAFLLAPSFGGCRSEIAKTSSDSNPASESKDGDSAAPQVDIATQPNTLPEKGATAKEVCQRFLGLLKQGERNLAEQLLTRRALKVTIDAGLELEAMGGDGSSINVKDAIYATSRAQVAQVPCTVTGEDGAEQSLFWVMRRGDSGWRISGLIVNSGKSQELLSLENRSDVAAIMGAKGNSSEPANMKLAEGSSDPAKIRQVSATDDE